MFTLIHEGGVPTVFLLLLGVAGLAWSAFFAARPARRRLRTLRALGLALVATTLGATFASLGAVFHAIPARFGDKPEWPTMLMVGLGESMSAGILGFGFLAAMALVAALGVGRMADDAA